MTDDTRIRAAVPTIRKVLEGGGSVILMSHLGRPKKKNPDPKYSLEQIVPAIERLLGTKVLFAGDCMGDKAATARDPKPGEVMLLENLRFYAEGGGQAPRPCGGCHRRGEESSQESVEGGTPEGVRAAPGLLCRLLHQRRTPARRTAPTPPRRPSSPTCSRRTRCSATSWRTS